MINDTFLNIITIIALIMTASSFIAVVHNAVKLNKREKFIPISGKQISDEIEEFKISEDKIKEYKLKEDMLKGYNLEVDKLKENIQKLSKIDETNQYLYQLEKDKLTLYKQISDGEISDEQTSLIGANELIQNIALMYQEMDVELHRQVNALISINNALVSDKWKLEDKKEYGNIEKFINILFRLYENQLFVKEIVKAVRTRVQK